MEHVSIPDIPIKSSRVGLGTWAMGGDLWGHTDDVESIRTIHSALERGINLIDTAPAYGDGHAEEVVGRAVAERGGRGQMIIASKVGLGMAWQHNISDRIPRADFQGDRGFAFLGACRRIASTCIRCIGPIRLSPLKKPPPSNAGTQTAGQNPRHRGIQLFRGRDGTFPGEVAPLASAQPPHNVF